MANSNRGYYAVSVWAFFISFINTGRKYFQYKNDGMEDYTHYSVLFRHFIANFAIFLVIGLLVVFVYNKLKQK